ncbi:MAG: hypothetical protein ACM359_20685, partial [Bacillota bacterium]
RLVRAVGESLGVSNQPAVEGSSELELAGGIRAKLPQGLATCAVEDRFRTQRILVARRWNGWLGVAMSPCVVLEDDPGKALASMLSLRDPAWHGARVWKVSEEVWACQKPGGDRFPGIGYLRTDGKGAGVLAEFRWNRLSTKAGTNQRQVQVLGGQLMAGLRFAGEGSVRKLVHAGAAGLRQVSGDVGRLVDVEKPVEEQWEWYDEASPRVSRMTVRRHGDAKDLWGTWEGDRSVPLGTSGQELCQWRLARDGGSYDYALRRVGARAMVSQESHLVNGRWNTVVRQGEAVVGQASGDVPEAYVPGVLLPLVMGRLPYEPMVLRTESILMPGGSASAQPMVLVLEPDFDLPKVPPGQDEAMRCWRVQVSGSGQVSRWYIDGEGRLDSIDFADGVHLHRG